MTKEERKEYMRNYWATHREAQKEYKRKASIKHKARISEYFKDWYAANRSYQNSQSTLARKKAAARKRNLPVSALQAFDDASDVLSANRRNLIERGLYLDERTGKPYTGVSAKRVATVD